MRAAYLDEARQEQVSKVVQDVLHERGALVSDHSGSRILFRGYKPGGKHTWDRGGYVGIYQHEGEKEVEVRLLLRARWPYRLLWTVAVINVIAAIVTFVLNPNGTVWFGVAALAAFALITAWLLYLNTLKPVFHEERDLMEGIETAFARGFKDIETADEREERLFEESLQGELEKRRADIDRRNEPEGPRRSLISRLPKPNFQLARPQLKLRKKANDDPVDAEAEAKRARLEELRKKVEAKRAAESAAAPEDAPAEKKRGFSLPTFGRKKKAEKEGPPADETPEARRARLLARKAELEAEREDDE